MCSICELVEAFHFRYITEYYRLYDTSSIDISLYFRLCVLSASWWKPFILDILLNITSSIDLSLYFRLCVLSASWWKPFILDILLNITSSIYLSLYFRLCVLSASWWKPARPRSTLAGGRCSGLCGRSR